MVSVLMVWPSESNLIDCGVDWFTTTSVNHADNTLLAMKANVLLEQEYALGFERKGWHMYGYSGWRCGRCEFGERPDGCIVRLSSDFAALHWWDLFQITGRCSRLDLQATYRCVRSVNDEISAGKSYVINHQNGKTDGPTVTLWESSDGGMTLYLGKRSSALYFRAYNKFVQSGDEAYRNCLRVELEVKNRLCLPVLDILLSSSTVQHGILLCLSAYAQNCGIPPKIAENLPCLQSKQSTIVTDTVKSLLWVRNCVRPTVQRLIDRGLLVEVISALDLTSVLESTQSETHKSTERLISEEVM